jgi:hypothetical protein
MNNSFSAEKLAELLHEQAELLEQLIEFGKQQRDAIQNARMSELLAVLGSKQPMLDRLGKLREHLHNVRTLIESPTFWPNATIRSHCQAMRDQASCSFQTLIKFESECEIALAESRDQIHLRLQSIDSGRTAANAYKAQTSVPPSSSIDFSSIG